jgi:hypothetical protein
MKTLTGIITTLERMNTNWNNKYMLFADSGYLCIINRDDGHVIRTFENIVCDGGDPDDIYIDGERYLKHYYYLSKGEAIG